MTDEYHSMTSCSNTCCREVAGVVELLPGGAPVELFKPGVAMRFSWCAFLDFARMLRSR